MPERKAGEGREKRKKQGQMVVEGELTWGIEHTIQYTDGVLEDWTPKTYLILLANVTLINSIKNKKKKRCLILFVPYFSF